MTHDTQLLEAQAQRDERILDYDISQILDRAFGAGDVIGHDARSALMGVVKFYAQNPHPYRSCVTDNMKHWGPGKTERVCATLKDMICGTTRWRNNESIVMSDLTDEQRTEIILALTDKDWKALETVVFGNE